MGVFQITEEKHYLYIPIQDNAEKIPICLKPETGKEVTLSADIARTRVDYWTCLDLKELGYSGKIELNCGEELSYGKCIYLGTDWRKDPELYRENLRPACHYSLYRGKLERIVRCEMKEGRWQLTYLVRLLGRTGGDLYLGSSVSRDMLHWKEENIRLSEPKYMAASKEEEISDYFIGEAEQTVHFYDEGRHLVMARSGELEKQGIPFHNVLSLPFLIEEQGEGRRLRPADSVRKLRVWKREWHGCSVADRFTEELRFSILPDEWPHMRICPSTGTADDIVGECFEIDAVISVGQEYEIYFSFCGLKAHWVARTGILYAGDYELPLPVRKGKIHIRAVVDHTVAEIWNDSQVLFIVNQYKESKKRRVGNDLTGNMYCNMEEAEKNTIEVYAEKGTATLTDLYIYGLRSIHMSPQSRRMAEDSMNRGEALFRSSYFTVYTNQVEDQIFGEPPAYVPDAETVISPVRVMEEFCWRNTPWGDMTRVINRDELWKPAPDIKRYPMLNTGIPTVDAAYRIAVDVFSRCSGKEYSLENQEYMWTAGMFQGKGEGFGVWVRDSAHIALRSGLLIDPETGRRTLKYTAEQGFDNGADGIAMAVSGIWEYYLATGDRTLICDTWNHLKEQMQRADELFDHDKGLMKAPQSTSNDAFEEPECGGYCLSTEIYFAYAYQGMAHMGRIMSEQEEQVRNWEERWKTLSLAIKTEYWNEEYGYFTSGPKGSESYENGCWESSGEEAAIWDKFGIADERQRRSVLNKLGDTALNEFGISAFPYRKEKNHYCHSNWVVWSAGFSHAAAIENDSELLMKLIFQQVRSCIMNKTFYEVIDADTGRTWRWPGQLWHAAGFISYFTYGLLGICYDRTMMSFSPCVPKSFENFSLRGLYYGEAQFDIQVHGYGTAGEIRLNEKAVSGIPGNLTGIHKIDIYCTQPLKEA